MATREYGRTPVGAIIQGQLDWWFLQKILHIRKPEEITAETLHSSTVLAWLFPHLNNIPRGGINRLDLLLLSKTKKPRKKSAA